MIVIEETLFVGFVCSFLTLSLVEKLTKECLRLGILGGLIGGVIGLIYPLFNVSGLWLLPLFLATISLINIICFKYLNFKDFLEREVLISLITLLFGGGCLAIENFFGRISLIVVSGVCLGLFILIKWTLKIRAKREVIDKFTYPVMLKNGDDKIEVEGFLDSGNMLYDEITKKPIMLVDFDVFHKFYSDISFLHILTKAFDESKIKNGHYVKVNSLSAGKSMLVFSVDEALVGEKRRIKEPMLGLSLSGFEKTFGRSILLHSELV